MVHTIQDFMGLGKTPQTGFSTTTCFRGGGDEILSGAMKVFTRGKVTRIMKIS